MNSNHIKHIVLSMAQNDGVQMTKGISSLDGLFGMGKDSFKKLGA